jgi:hypothetical protein
MKTMLILLAMLVSGSAFAGELINIFPSPIDIRTVDTTRQPIFTTETPRPVINQEAYQPSKVDYSIITLPDGKTATVLSFK